MARQIRNAKLDTRTAREKLRERKAPYWASISKGRSIGYRKGAKAGVWLAKYVGEDKRAERRLGIADDILDADGIEILDFAQAQKQARAFFSECTYGDAERPVGPYTVRDAMADYMRWYGRNRKAVEHTQNVVDVHILPKLGDKELAKLRKRDVEDWHSGIATAPRMLRTRKGKERQVRKIDPNDADAVRRRRSTANRCLTVLKAALNRALEDRKIGSDNAWRAVKPFRNADAARVRFLTDDEARRLVNAAALPFRSMIVAGLYTGCRYGELAALRVADFNAKAGTVHVRESKSGKPRHVALTDEGTRFFQTATAGKLADALIFTREKGGAWQRSQQARPMREACATAKVSPPISFHGLRHTYASRLVMAGAPLAVVAEQLGHSDTRMVEKHYGHLAPGYVANTVRALFSAMMLTPKDEKVAPINAAR